MKNGVCRFGTRCHYRHDIEQRVAQPAVDDGEVDIQILNMRKEISCRNFGAGGCPYGQRCFYRHVDASGRVVEETGVDALSTVSLLRFVDPHGDGDVSAAGVIPYARGEGDAVWALLQVEDMFDEESGSWKPALAMFGGKVGGEDKDWLHTAAREFMEETGGLVGDLNKGIPQKMANFVVDDEDDAFAYTKYLEYSKFQVLFYPVTDPSDLKRMRDLPGRYAKAFKGEVSADWTRAAVRLESVLLRRDAEAGWAAYDYNTGARHHLPLKVPLLMALKAASFTLEPVSPSPATASPPDMWGGALESLLNMTVSTSPAMKRKPPRASFAQHSALAVLNESAEHGFGALTTSSEVLCA